MTENQQTVLIVDDCPAALQQGGLAKLSNILPLRMSVIAL